MFKLQKLYKVYINIKFMQKEGEDYITRKQLDERLKEVEGNGFSTHAGRSLRSLVDMLGLGVGITVAVGMAAYGAMSCAYGPYDTGKVIYAEVFGDKTLKHRTFEFAKALYAKRLQKQELDSRDMRNLFIELNVVSTENKKPTEEDITWYRLLDWIEDNN